MANVNFIFQDCIGNSYIGKVTLTPKSVTTGSNTVIVKDSVTSVVTTSGILNFPNLAPGLYEVNVIANRIVNEFNINVPTGSGTYNAGDLIV